MKNSIIILAVLFFFTNVQSQNKTHRNSVTFGASINHYNGNLGNSFFQYKTTCFGGGNVTFGNYINRNFDLNINANIGHFGYCQTDRDVFRMAKLELQCPGCTDGIAMAELRSLMIGVNTNLKYKFNNGYILKENSKIAPYVYTGVGITHLSDNMKKKCVNVGMHYTVNAGAGLRYNIGKNMHIDYTMSFSCFMTKKTYAKLSSTSDQVDNTHAEAEPDHHSKEMKSLEKRHDLLLQNTLSVGFSF